ncbi:Voltage-gated Ion Channel (VIC) Superfamily [Achlya hypogyna]|uniref:Voltage-gated Ion Channel (VIC) Superfamily n=1 Tax=Achlya hypogyna TaxID=1202772 RepID=A0A1V9YMM9_ACHHY|nr:Voltage-gated Ion Channel (VIC) Superfamily [Achlya hypogyna]
MELRPAATATIDVDTDMWARKKRVYMTQLTDRLANDAAFRAGFAKTLQHVRAIHKLSVDYERRRVAENRMFGVSTLSLLLVFLECATNAGWIRYANAVLTALLLLLLVQRYAIEREIAVGKGLVPPNAYIWELPPSFILAFLVELVICSLFLPPGLDGEIHMRQWIMASQSDSCPYGGEYIDGDCYLVYTYKYDHDFETQAQDPSSRYQILGLFVFLRVYQLPRYIRNLSDFYSARMAFVGSLNNVDALGVLFSIKYMLRSRPFPLLVVGFATTLLTVSCALWLLETPVNPLVSTYPSAMWLTIVTMATVGYGDRVPMTVPGQVLMVLGAMATGIIFVGILSASFFALLDLTDRDRNVLDLLSNEKEAKATSAASARLIQAAWNLHVCRQRSASPAVTDAATVLLYATAQTCRKLRKSRKLHVPSLHDQLVAEMTGLDDLAIADHTQRMQRLLALEAKLDDNLRAVREIAARTHE